MAVRLHYGQRSTLDRERSRDHPEAPRRLVGHRLRRLDPLTSKQRQLMHQVDGSYRQAEIKPALAGTRFHTAEPLAWPVPLGGTK
jgi:hypothetical protein